MLDDKGRVASVRQGTLSMDTAATRRSSLPLPSAYHTLNGSLSAFWSVAKEPDGRRS